MASAGESDCDSFSNVTRSIAAASAARAIMRASAVIRPLVSRQSLADTVDELSQIDEGFGVAFAIP